LTTLESSDVGVVLIATKSPDDKLELRIDYDAFANVGINRYIFRLPSSADERVWGGGEQFTYLNLRKGGRYPLWVREQVNNSHGRPQGRARGLLPPQGQPRPAKNSMVLDFFGKNSIFFAVF
jgi:hypothetical protein